MSKITSCYWIVDSSFFLYCEEVTKKGRPPVIGNSCLSLHSPAGLRNSLCSNSPLFFIFSFALASPIKVGIFPPRYYQPLRVKAIARRGIFWKNPFEILRGYTLSEWDSFVISNPPQAVWGIFCSFSRRFFIPLTLRSEWQPCHSEPRPMVECEESPLSISLAIVAIALSLYRRFFGTLHLRMVIMSSRM